MQRKSSYDVSGVNQVRMMGTQSLGTVIETKRNEGFGLYFGDKKQ